MGKLFKYRVRNRYSDAIFTTVCTALINGGFTTALIRKKDATDDDYNTVFISNLGMSLLLYAIIRTVVSKTYIGGIWPAGIGVVLVVLVLLLFAGWNHTAYYPSTADLQSSLTIANSCSSEFTLSTMAVVSLLIPFVLAYIAYCWYSLDKKKIDKDEITRGDVY